jgi:peptide/nickel transport system permease protein
VTATVDPLAPALEGRRRRVARLPVLRGRTRYVTVKVFSAILSLAFVLVFNFFLFRVLPGDPAKSLTRNRYVPADQVAALSKRFGLDEPLPQQFVHYVNATLHGDLGISYKYQQPVSDLIQERLWPTILLVGLSTILSAAIGLWFGVRGAWRRSTPFDKSTMGASLTLYAMPEFWLGLILLMVLGVGVGPLPGWFPTGGMESAQASPGWLSHVADVGKHLFLPCLTLTLAYVAEYHLVMRSSLLEEKNEDYLVTARAKGLRDTLVRRRHAVPNALLPTVTLIFLNFGFVVSGAITVETVYSWPGLGLLSYDALSGPDIPLLQGVFLLFSAGIIMFNLIADVAYGFLDPRVTS